ncbi:hypothetical protein N7509_001698 [Penicillium cosmopolitanum]|uniref:HAUS augmin-like complex subunit 6 N-terminal domain-containing protein n=1 Tax=Penicillium cosmopolitanum TaxID=1131564 RepID=A0A9W9W7Z7_9EURO|nr:uncharacterized protein N7509_001698 [Penicillium cosmopolitanum]KAJ5407815.1 hypothetical protein N7509_001698 [Penicillium cosmopolitanum]
MASRPARPKPLDWVTPPPLTVFIRNLKLLQLDQRDDWPDITLRALSPSSQNQRQRIRLVEWALYYLFAIWDPEYAQNVREKFDELLAVFSTAVLRKLLAVSALDTPWNPALKVATAAGISPTDYQNLLPLVLAHQVSLGATGARRAQAHETYDQFSQLLDNKKVELTQRSSLQSEKLPNYEGVKTAGLAQELQANWLGSEEWAITLLDGGSHSSTDGFLELPFSQAWSRAKDSSLDGLGGGVKSDLVVDLEARVVRLRSRLRRWHEFNDSLRSERGDNPNSAGTISKPRMQFRDHQAMTVASIAKAVRRPGDRGRSLKETDQSFMSSVNEAIARINVKVERFETRPVRNTEPLASQSPPSVSSEEPNDQNISPSPLEMTNPINPFPTFSPPDIQTSDYQENLHSSPPIVRLSPDQHSTEQLDLDQEPEPLKQRQQPPQNYTLAERTRKSMSLIPPLPAHENPRPRRRVFPPARRHPQDQLFQEDADYASVFKSRPRIALSPVSSPAVHVSPSFDEDEEFDLVYDDDDYDDAELEAADSPLAAQRVRRF